MVGLELAIYGQPLVRDAAAQAAALVGDGGRQPAESLGVQRLHALCELVVGAAQAVGLLAVGDFAHATVLHLRTAVLHLARLLGGDAVLVGVDDDEGQLVRELDRGRHRRELSCSTT